MRTFVEYYIQFDGKKICELKISKRKSENKKNKKKQKIHIF